MGRDAGRRRPRLTVVASAVILTLLGVAASPPSSASSKRPTTTTSTAPPKLAKVGHAAFWRCPAKTTELLVVVNTLTLHPGATLDVAYTVRNGATSSCNYTAPYAGVAPGPTAATLTAGPCGSIGFKVEDRHHRAVWPGNEVVNCPALGFAQLAPGATVSGAGSWDQTKPNSTHRVPPGNYTLVVDNSHFTFRLHIAAT